MKPDIVFFGEALPAREIAGAQAAMRSADLVVVAGTSLTVYPAAALPACRPSDSRLVILNRTETPLDSEADLVLHEDIGKALGGAVALL